MRRILCCGDRNWSSRIPIRAALAHLPADTVIIHGAARGADTIAGEEAARCGLEVKAYPADWDKYHKAAGPIRNKQMLDEGEPTEVFAFHNDLLSSKGTKDMCKRALKAGLKVTVFGNSGSFVLTRGMGI